MINKEYIKAIINDRVGDYEMGFVTSYNIIDMIVDNIPGEDNDVAMRLLEKRDELLKPLNDFFDNLVKQVNSGKDISEIV